MRLAFAQSGIGGYRKFLAVFVSAAMLLGVMAGVVWADDGDGGGPPVDDAPAVVWVATSGDDEDKGTESQPKQTIQAAIDTVGAGGIVYVKSGGTFTGNLLIDKPLTLVSVGGRATIRGTTGSNAPVVKVTASDVTIGTRDGGGRGFTINPGSSAQPVAAVYLAAGLENVTIEDSQLRAASGKSALLTEGGQKAHVFKDTTFETTGSNVASQLVYVNGNASVSTPSSDITFINNKFQGKANLVLGVEADGLITNNTFNMTEVNYALVELFDNHQGVRNVFWANTFASGAAVAVDGNKQKIFGSIQPAVDNAEEGGTVYVAPGLYEENVTLSKKVSLRGAGSSSTVIAPETGNAIAITGHTTGEIDGVNIQGFTLRPAVGAGLIALSGTVAPAPTTKNLYVEDVYVDGGLGIILNAADGVQLHNVAVGNVSASTGALELTGVANLSVTNSRFSDNKVGIRLQSTEGLDPTAYGSNGPVSVHESVFFGNEKDIVNGGDGEPIDATRNAWEANVPIIVGDVSVGDAYPSNTIHDLWALRDLLANTTTSMIILNDGDYGQDGETAVVDIKRSGVTVKAANKHKAVLKGRIHITGLNKENPVELVVVDGLKIVRQVDRGGPGIEIGTSSIHPDKIYILNNVIDSRGFDGGGNNNAGIQVRAAGAVIGGNTIQGNSGNGIWVNTGFVGRDLTISGNIIDGNRTGINFDASRDGVFVTIADNTIINNTAHGISIGGSVKDTFTITNNRFSGNIESHISDRRYASSDDDSVNPSKADLVSNNTISGRFAWVWDENGGRWLLEPRGPIIISDGDTAFGPPAPTAGSGTVDETGGTVTADEANLEITVPAGAVSGEVTFTITPVDDGDAPPTGAGMFKIGNYMYQIEATDANGNPVTQFSRDITLTFHFDLADLGGNSLADLQVYYWDEDLKAWIAIPTTAHANGTVVATVDHLTVFALMADKNAPHFSDISGHWGEADILKLASLGIVSGVGGGKFDPEGPVTRAQFARMIVGALGLGETDAALDFTDAASIPSWAVGYVATAVAEGIIQGMADGSFAPDAHITREQIAVMIARALKLSLEGESDFADNEMISEWARGAVKSVADRGIVGGIGGNNFAPANRATRAQAVRMLSRMMSVRLGLLGTPNN